MIDQIIVVSLMTGHVRLSRTLEVASSKCAQSAPILDEDNESPTCESNDAFGDRLASDPCVACPGPEPNGDANQPSRSPRLLRIWHARRRRSWVSRDQQDLARREHRRRRQQRGADAPPPHTPHAPRPTCSTRSPQIHRQDQRRTLARRPAKTRVYWTSSACEAQLQKATAGPCTHSFSGPTVTTWHTSRTSASVSCVSRK